MFIKAKLIFMALLALLLLAGQCGAQPEQGAALPARESEAATDQSQTLEASFAELTPVPLGSAEKLKVVATTNIIGDIVKNVGGNRIDLTVMLPAGADPHTFNPTPGDAATVADAHVIFINGLNLEEFMAGLIGNAGGQAVVIPVSTGVETREFGEAHEHSEGDMETHGHEEDEPEDEEGHEHEEGEADSHQDGADPHIWTTPVNGIIMAHNIKQALSKLDPANAETYAANAEAYKAELEALDTWIKSQVATIPAEKRKLVTDHETFGYYADRYGFEIIGAVIPAASTNAEPSAQEMAQLQKTIAETEAKAVFVGTTVSPVLAERLAEDSGIQLVPLYSDSLGEPGSGAETYLDYLRYNTNAIVGALK